MTTIQETIDRLRELDRKASPSPWSYLILPVDPHTGIQDSVLLDGAGLEFSTNAEDAFTRNDFDIILEARNAIPALLAEIERLTAENQALTTELTEAGVPIKPLQGEQEMSTEQKIYTAAEVASVGYSKEEIDEDVAYVTQRAYKAAKYGEKSVTHSADNYLLHQITHRLRELGYTVQLTREYASSKYITVWWDNADPTKEEAK